MTRMLPLTRFWGCYSGVIGEDEKWASSGVMGESEMASSVEGGSCVGGGGDTLGGGDICGGDKFELM